MEAQLQNLSNDISVAQTSHDALAQKVRITDDQIVFLRANIKFLKKDRVVVVATEFRKSKESLQVAEVHLMALTANLNEAKNQIAKMREIFQKMFAEYRAFRFSRGVLLTGNFKGRKSGQK